MNGNISSAVSTWILDVLPLCGTGYLIFKYTKIMVAVKKITFFTSPIAILFSNHYNHMYIKTDIARF